MEQRQRAALAALAILAGGWWWLARRQGALALADGPELGELDYPELGELGAFLASLEGTARGAVEDVVIAVTPPPENADANLAAFLAAVRRGEGTADADGYRRLFGGGLIDSFADHPRRVVTATLGGKVYRSSAAGAYQALSTTWDDFTRSVGPRDFSPASQDEFAVWCIRRRGALADVRAGRFQVAIAKCAKEWASLPGSPYGQPTISMGTALEVYASAGGTLAA